MISVIGYSQCRLTLKLLKFIEYLYFSLVYTSYIIIHAVVRIILFIDCY